MMGNHGITVAADTVGYAFDQLYYFEKACETVITAYSTGKPLNILSDDVARLTCQQWIDYPSLWQGHWYALRKMLDEEEPGYRT
jgi:ribulose-5-phosphate 4-epimerase/fuculose-1-phosphate aldolase